MQDEDSKFFEDYLHEIDKSLDKVERKLIKVTWWSNFSIVLSLCALVLNLINLIRILFF